MELLTVEPIPKREWKDKKDRRELVKERDKNRKKSQQSVDERIHYMWFNYLQLCLNLEEINYSVPKRGGRGKIISTTNVKVSKSITHKGVFHIEYIYTEKHLHPEKIWEIYLLHL